MTPRPKKELDYTSFLVKDPNRMIDRGLEYYISNSSEDFSSDRMKLVNQFGMISVYKVIAPVQRLKPACIVHPPRKNCDRVLDITEMDEGNTGFNYRVNLPSKRKLTFYGFNNGNWKVNINGDDNPTVEWTKSHAMFTLPAGTHTVSFKYEISSLKTYWAFFKLGLLLYLLFLGWVVLLHYRGGQKRRIKMAPAVTE